MEYYFDSVCLEEGDAVALGFVGVNPRTQDLQVLIPHPLGSRETSTPWKQQERQYLAPGLEQRPLCWQLSN